MDKAVQWDSLKMKRAKLKKIYRVKPYACVDLQQPLFCFV